MEIVRQRCGTPLAEQGFARFRQEYAIVNREIFGLTHVGERQFV